MSTVDSSGSAPPRPPRSRRGHLTVPDLISELVGSALGSWDRTLQLAVLMSVPIATVTTIVFYLRLEPERWLAVVGCAITAITAASAARRRRRRRDTSRPTRPG